MIEPLPGTAEARAQGCSCPVAQPGLRVPELDGAPAVFAVNPVCMLHAQGLSFDSMQAALHAASRAKWTTDRAYRCGTTTLTYRAERAVDPGAPPQVQALTASCLYLPVALTFGHDEAAIALDVAGTPPPMTDVSFWDGVAMLVMHKLCVPLVTIEQIANGRRGTLHVAQSLADASIGRDMPPWRGLGASHRAWPPPQAWPGMEVTLVGATRRTVNGPALRQAIRTAFRSFNCDPVNVRGVAGPTTGALRLSVFCGSILDLGNREVRQELERRLRRYAHLRLAVTEWTVQGTRSTPS